MRFHKKQKFYLVVAELLANSSPRLFYVVGYVLVPSIEKKREVSEKELKRKELYVKITEVWQAALTRALKIEVAGGGVGKRLRYSKGKCEYRPMNYMGSGT